MGDGNRSAGEGSVAVGSTAVTHPAQQPPGPPPPGGGPPGPPFQGPPPHQGPPGPHGWHPPGPYQQPPARRGSGALGWIIGISAGAVVLVAVAVVVVAVALRDTGGAGGSGDPGPGNRPEAARGTEESGDVPGTQTFDVPSYNHVEGIVDYPQHPPVGGDHNAVWLNCGVYTTQVPAENAVHSLEHGAVWITHDPDLDPGQVALLHGLYSAGDYVIISPVPDLPAPVVLSAWGKQLAVDSPEDTRVVDFLRVYERGPQTPEPGAPCSGGISVRPA